MSRLCTARRCVRLQRDVRCSPVYWLGDDGAARRDSAAGEPLVQETRPSERAPNHGTISRDLRDVDELVASTCSEARGSGLRRREEADPARGLVSPAGSSASSEGFETSKTRKNGTIPRSAVL